MSTVARPADRPAVHPQCPSCGLPAQDPRYRRDEFIATGEYVDALGHIWRVMWLADPDRGHARLPEAG